MRRLRGLLVALAFAGLGACAGSYVAGDVGGADAPRHGDFAPVAPPRS